MLGLEINQLKLEIVGAKVLNKGEADAENKTKGRNQGFHSQ